MVEATDGDRCEKLEEAEAKLDGCCDSPAPPFSGVRQTEERAAEGLPAVTLDDPEVRLCGMNECE